MRQPRTAVNRTVLAAAGLALLLGGGRLASAGTDVLPGRPPAWWPAAPAGGVLLDREGLAALRGQDWWTPAVVTVGVLATVLFAVWFLAQVRVRTRSLLPLAAPGGAVRTRALADALAERAATVDGVTRCHARVHAGPRILRVRLRVRLAPDTTPADVLGPLAAATAEAERAAAPYTLDARVRLSHQKRPRPHVR
ncbi:hypothetical protein [Streptomyces zingiberis]|uniref:Alkaline shock response membrane anchor protein AmaP n=1 Tax=Streptomyces zingiberis TaxID=2053010 RepID=A0ABX1BXF8_9ACTN|nr:hypothetical protein [Streptomyces zingiberis]NJQ01151.1 hypothetical protein [Streptomyces zingiberis]